MKILFLAPVVVALILFCLTRSYRVDDFMSEGNRYRQSYVELTAVDKDKTTNLMEFDVKLTYNDLRNQYYQHVIGSTASGLVRMKIDYPTFEYRTRGRPKGWRFFRGFQIEVTAPGYEITQRPFPEYIAKNKELPPETLTAITIDMYKK